MTLAQYERLEREQEELYRCSLLCCCATEDEHLEVSRGLVPDRVQRRAEAQHSHSPRHTLKETP